MPDYSETILLVLRVTEKIDDPKQYTEQDYLENHMKDIRKDVEEAVKNTLSEFKDLFKHQNTNNINIYEIERKHGSIIATFAIPFLIDIAANIATNGIYRYKDSVSKRLRKLPKNNAKKYKVEQNVLSIEELLSQSQTTIIVNGNATIISKNTTDD